MSLKGFIVIFFTEMTYLGVLKVKSVDSRYVCVGDY